jgi:Alw26I/Eco31I/Esp3I family type II restriction m6 adenine DNA methyltransferase
VRYLEIATRASEESSPGKNLLIRATGKFYTHEIISQHLATAISRRLPQREIAVVDPFCGDGRLLVAFLTAAKAAGFRYKVRLFAWDRDEVAVTAARRAIRLAAEATGLPVDLSARTVDTFRSSPRFFERFDIVLTNPPWEVLKPDRRDLAQLGQSARAEFIASIRQQADYLSRVYPASQPKMKFSGWGTNLARVGTEVALRLTAKEGICAFVSPSSLLADQMSQTLREQIFKQFELVDLAHYPAEARLFKGVDQAAITVVAIKHTRPKFRTTVCRYDAAGSAQPARLLTIDAAKASLDGYCLPLQLGPTGFSVFAKLRPLRRFGELEQDDGLLWAGRELDETAHKMFLAAKGDFLFVKGNMIKRFGFSELPKHFIASSGPRIPSTASFSRIAWRDVARPNQSRRLHATIIPERWVTGNSLNVAYFRDGNQERLKALLAVVNSFVFEIQVRALLATAHISLGAVRRAHIPHLDSVETTKNLATWTDRCLSGDANALVDFEVAVAQAYRLSRQSFHQLIKLFPCVTADRTQRLLESSAWRN